MGEALPVEHGEGDTVELGVHEGVEAVETERKAEGERKVETVVEDDREECRVAPTETIGAWVAFALCESFAENETDTTALVDADEETVGDPDML